MRAALVVLATVLLVGCRRGPTAPKYEPVEAECVVSWRSSPTFPPGPPDVEVPEVPAAGWVEVCTS